MINYNYGKSSIHRLIDLKTNLFQFGFNCSGNWSSSKAKHTGGDQFSKHVPSAPARKKPGFMALPIPKSAELPYHNSAFSVLEDC